MSSRSRESITSSYVGLYENGHWEWDDSVPGLKFVSDVIVEEPVTEVVIAKAIPTEIDFRDNIDLIEQLHFRKKYQRKVLPGEPNVITIQDIKDLAIYTAPPNLLSRMLLQILHIPTTERFIRSLILYCQYYLQVFDEMQERSLASENKIRTPMCDSLEEEFRENLADLRILVAKEYCIMLLGAGDTQKFHHMGPQKKTRSLYLKDMRLYETLLRICIQIVWLALHRRSFNQIELELNRLFKTDLFNSVEHRLHTGFISKMSKEERRALLGTCVRHTGKLRVRSPLVNEVFCERKMDYQMFGLGLVKQENLSHRLTYMLMAICAPEEELLNVGISLGILGQDSDKYDTMLRIVPVAPVETTPSKPRWTSSVSVHKTSKGSISPSSRSSTSSTYSQSQREKKPPPPSYPYSRIELPQRLRHEAKLPSELPEEVLPPRPVHAVQFKRWMKRLNKVQSKRQLSSKNKQPTL